MSTILTRRWPHAAAGAVLMLFLGSMYAWSYFKVALGEVFPAWTQTQITFNFTLMMCVFCAGGVLAGRISKRIPKPAQMIFSGILMFLGFLGTSFLPVDNPQTAIYLLYFFYGVLNGLGTGIAYNAVLSTAPPWYPDRPSLISGVLLMCLGFGSLILGNVASVLYETFGLASTFRIFALADLIAMLALAPLVRVPGANDNLPQAKQSAQSGESAVRDYTTSEMLRRPTFWIYFCWNVCLSAGGQLIINSASSMSVWYGAAATIGLLVSVFNALARLAVGSLMDKLHWKVIMYLINGLMLAAGILMYLGDRIGVSFPIFVGMMLVGCCYGSGITIAAVLVRKLYGSKYYASNFSFCNLCTFPAAIIGPMISAALQDSSVGYTSTFVMVIVIALISLGANFFIRKP